QLRIVDLWCPVDKTIFTGASDLMCHLSGLKQYFTRHAAGPGAVAAQLFFFHKQGLRSKVSGQSGGRKSRRASANNDCIKIKCTHLKSGSGSVTLPVPRELPIK